MGGFIILNTFTMNRSTYLFMIVLISALGATALAAPDDKAGGPALENEANATDAKEKKPVPAKDDKTKAPAKAPSKESINVPVAKPTDIIVFDDESGASTFVPTGDQAVTKSPTVMPTESLPFGRVTSMPSEDLPLTVAPTLEPTSVLLDRNEVMTDVATNTTADDGAKSNETHVNFYTSDTSQHDMFKDSMLESDVVASENVKTHYALQYGLIGACMTLVLSILCMLIVLRRKAKERRKGLPVTTAAGVLGAEEA
jgi:hypothetical protein